MPRRWTFHVPWGRIEFHPTPTIDDRPKKPLSAFVLPLIGWLFFLIGWSVLGLLLCLVAYRLSRAQVLDTYSYMIGTFVGEIVWFAAIMLPVTVYIAAGETGSAIIPIYVVGFAACFWHVARCLKAIVFLVRDQRIADPGTWWV